MLYAARKNGVGPIVTWALRTPGDSSARVHSLIRCTMQEVKLSTTRVLYCAARPLVMHRCVLGLGSNLGQRAATIHAAPEQASSSQRSADADRSARHKIFGEGCALRRHEAAGTSRESSASARGGMRSA